MTKFTYCKKIFIVVSNTQLVERRVKDSNNCTLSGKDEHFSLFIGMCQSMTVFEYKSLSLKITQLYVKSKQMENKWKVGESICKKTAEKEDENTKIKDVKGSLYTNLVICETIVCDKCIHGLQAAKEEQKN